MTDVKDSKWHLRCPYCHKGFECFVKEEKKGCPDKEIDWSKVPSGALLSDEVYFMGIHPCDKSLAVIAYHLPAHLSVDCYSVNGLNFDPSVKIDPSWYKT